MEMKTTDGGPHILQVYVAVKRQSNQRLKVTRVVLSSVVVSRGIHGVRVTSIRDAKAAHPVVLPAGTFKTNSGLTETGVIAALTRTAGAPRAGPGLVLPDLKQ